MKLKINGRCVNKCSYCKFHDDPSLLEVRDIEKFFEILGHQSFAGLIINGGEPTIHPRFMDICDFLSDHFTGKVLLRLGTNLIPLARSSERYQNIYKKVLSTFDHLDVGCDDEHNNIDVLESLAPDITRQGLSITVNVVNGYCSEQTLGRIKAVECLPGITVNLSNVYSTYEGRRVRNSVLAPCRHRFRNFVMDCNGNTFFCYQQEYEKPLFNCFSVKRDEMLYFMNYYDPGIFKFCSYCDLYEPDTLVQTSMQSFLF